METCLAPGDTWNMCADKKKMSFDLVSCSTKVAYASVAVSCIDSVPGTAETYVTVYNGGAVDNSTLFQFACFALSNDMTKASVAPGYCRKSQTSSSWPIDVATNNEIGGTLDVTNTYETCREYAFVLKANYIGCLCLSLLLKKVHLVK
ncbi:uncharacterized protein LOC127878702 [Dreissena polymorpha]|uniref:uncharacterized protein LOC127878702 n=1 Tax=Dreissena polymorpha TaxID=45954 RepID=UPI002263CEEF|nr:uncharacterized protein LOC127878702 [Dreissena polymorpha]